MNLLLSFFTNNLDLSEKNDSYIYYLAPKILIKISDYNCIFILKNRRGDCVNQFEYQKEL